MGERLNVTTADGESAVWSPAAESILQMQAEAGAIVEIQARVNASAPWAPVETMTLNRGSLFTRLPKFPFLKLVVTRNTAGSAVKVWDNK